MVVEDIAEVPFAATVHKAHDGIKCNANESGDVRMLQILQHHALLLECHDRFQISAAPKSELLHAHLDTPSTTLSFQGEILSRLGLESEMNRLIDTSIEYMVDRSIDRFIDISIQ